jgi:hypothetical protein
MNIEELIHDLRARINPQYYDQLGTESYERHQVVKALEYLATENERLKELMAKRAREHQQEMTSFRLRVRSQDDATFAALRDDVNGLTGSLDRAESVLQNLMSYLSVNGCRTEIDPENAELRILDGINMLVRPAVERAERAEAALKEAQEQPPSFWVSADGFRSRGSGRNIATKPEKRKSDDVPLYASPVPAAPAVAVPAVPDQFRDVTKLIVPQEWRDVITELADDLSIELDMRYQSRSHYPSELRKYENEMQPVYRARALLQSGEVKK